METSAQKVELETFTNLRLTPKEITRVCTNTKIDTIALVRSDNSIEFLSPAHNIACSFYPLSKGWILPIENSIESAVLLDDCTVLGSCLDGSLFFLRPGDITPFITISSLGGGSVWGVSVLNGNLALACEDGSLRICNLENHEITLRKTSIRHSSRLLSCAISPDGLFIACGSSDGQVRIYKTSSGNCFKQLKVPHPSGSSGNVSVWCVHWIETQDEVWIASGDSLGQTTIWNSAFELANATCFRAHLADVLSLSSYNGHLYASGIDNRTTQFILAKNANGGKIWTKAFSRRIASHDVKSMAVYQEKYLLTASSDGVLRSSSLVNIQSKEHDHFYSALPSSCIINSCCKDVMSVSLETGQLLLLNSSYESFACIKLINNEPIVDHAVCGPVVAITTPTSTKFFEFSASQISKIVSFENLSLTALSAKNDSISFGGVSVDENGKVDLYEFTVSRDEDGACSVQKTKRSSRIALPTGVFMRGKLVHNDFIFTSNAQLLNAKTEQVIPLPCNSQCSVFLDGKGIFAIGLVNGQLLLLDPKSDTKQLFTLSTDFKWISRPILSIVNCPSYDRLLIYNENMIISFNLSTHSIHIVQEVPCNNIMHLAVNDEENIRILSRPWDQVVEDLPPAFSGPRFGLN
jgi:hypothetical protein